ncbi:glycosyltransferase family 4 protein [Myxococcota bacterium]|nr:glycosyltransferase family 4 protein [Myxococcota bacterium]
MRVAMVGLRAPWGVDGGVEGVVGELAPRLALRGCEVTVLCRTRYNRLGPGLHQGVRLVDVDTVYSKHLEAFVHTGAAMPAALRHADLVHVHALGPALWSWWPRLRGRRTVVTVHGLDWQRDKWGPLARAALRAGEWAAGACAHQVVTVSHDLAEHYARRHGVQATWIPNGVAPIPAVPLEQAGLPDLVPGRFLLLLGRLVPEKGVEGLLQAYARAALDEPLVIVGGSSYSEAYVQALHRAAPPGVRFTGPLHGARRDALLSNARALVLPSRLEGFPLAPLESLAAGRPVLLSDIPPHRELLEDTEAGWLVSPGVEPWTAALRQLVATPQARLAAMGAAGRAHVLSRYGWDDIADRTVGLYRQVMAGPPSPQAPRSRLY